MSTQRTPAAPLSFPPKQPGELQTVQTGLDLLRDWRGASVATAIVMGALLPFAVAWHVSYAVTIAACAIGAVSLALGCHALRERRLAALAIFPELARLPDLARKRRRLTSTSSRQALAGGLRRAATPSNLHTGSTVARCFATVSRGAHRDARTCSRVGAGPRPRPHERCAHTRTAHQRLQPARQPQPLDRRAPRNPDRCACRNGPATALTSCQTAMSRRNIR